MCGIAGYIDCSAMDHRSTLVEMTNRIAHRGPDASGVWHDDAHGVHLGFRRLAIIELSDAGQQPMHSASGRYVVIYNGEIYNHLQLREELVQSGLQLAFQGKSDTETLLEGIEYWGLNVMLEKCIGMFAFALWDRKRNQLYLARDRMGEKPLYYGWVGKAFVFASELHCFKAHPEFDKQISTAALGLLIKYSYIRAPHSIYKDIYKLPPAHILTLSGNSPKIEAYWSLEQCIKEGQENRADQSAQSERAAIDNLQTIMLEAVGRQMVADVPLGAFLSGGIDSSIIVALMQAQSAQAVKTFSIGFHEKGYDEAVYAKAVAEHLGTDHTEVYVSSENAQSVIPQLVDIYSEPFADSSQIPTLLVSKVARENVTVCLSGDGGDEFFCGYDRYRIASRVWNNLSKIPYPIRRAIFKGLKSIPSNALNGLSNSLGFIKNTKGNRILTATRMNLAINLLATDRVQQFYELGTSHCVDATDYLANQHNEEIFSDAGHELTHLSNEQVFMFLDAMDYLPNDILVKVDRAAMSTSLETRVPFLDHKVVEFAWRLPQSMKNRQGQGKWILRELLEMYLPKQLIERPKMGFAIPLGPWLAGPLKDWAYDLLDPVSLNQQAYFNSEAVTKIWQRHLSGNYEHTYLLWNILMFQAWVARE